jgi:hypothetical protein
MRNATCDKRYATCDKVANRKSSTAWYCCLALILVLYGLLFLFRSHIPEPWTALVAIGLLIVYRVLRYWLHPKAKRNKLIHS